MSTPTQAPTEAEAVLPPTHRACPRCGYARRYPQEFHRHANYKDGRNKICAFCQNRKSRMQRDSLPGRVSVRHELELEEKSRQRESRRIEAANERAFDRLRANTNDAIARRPA